MTTEESSRRGLILINTGPGKGKTTAAMGTALRAVGNGMRVLMLQFLKGSWHYGELDSTQAFGESFILKQMGRGFVKVGGAETDPEDIRLVGIDDAPYASLLPVPLTTVHQPTREIGEAALRAMLDRIHMPFGSSLTISNKVSGDLAVTLASGRALLVAQSLESNS